MLFVCLHTWGIKKKKLAREWYLVGVSHAKGCSVRMETCYGIQTAPSVTAEKDERNLLLNNRNKKRRRVQYTTKYCAIGMTGLGLTLVGSLTRG